jgi:hypothetical protein
MPAQMQKCWRNQGAFVSGLVDQAHQPNASSSMQSTYTGVYSRGGPTNVDRPKDLAGITNRKPANNRGVALPFNKRGDLTARSAPLGSRTASLAAAATPRRTSSGAGRSSRLGSPSSSMHGGVLTPMQSAGSMMEFPRSARRRSSSGGAALTPPMVEQLPGWENLSVPHDVCHHSCISRPLHDNMKL